MEQNNDFNWFVPPDFEPTWTNSPPVEVKKFRINVSREGYINKEEALACIKQDTAKKLGKEPMAFMEQELSIPEFLAKASLGHSFCHLFENDPGKKYSQGKMQIPASPFHQRGKNKGCLKFSMKANVFFKGSQCIFIDVDETKAPSMMDYLCRLRFPPSCAYPSYSDGKLKNGSTSRRFHLVYVFNEVLDKYEFLRISKTLTKIIEEDTGEAMADTCGERLSQYMNGCYGILDTYNGDRFYSRSVFPAKPEDKIYQSIKKDCDEEKITFNQFMLEDMKSLDYKTFTHSYSKRYGYVYRTEGTEWQEYQGIKYQMTNENYLQLWHYSQKIPDGEKRRTKMAQRCCLRRLIKPDITPDELLYQLYIDRERYFDNSDGVLDVDTMRRKVENAMSLTDEELYDVCKISIDYWHENHPQFILHPDTENHQSAKRIIERETNYLYLDKAYDASISVSENVLNLPFSESTIYRYRKDRGVSMSKEEKKDIFVQNYSRNLSVDENIEILKNKGLVLSKRSIFYYISKYIR